MILNIWRFKMNTQRIINNCLGRKIINDKNIKNRKTYITEKCNICGEKFFTNYPIDVCPECTKKQEDEWKTY